jgi:HAD superfamily hydrolase (TIGR01549 family)
VTPHTPPGPVLVFDLDGTLVDSVYQHVLAWQAALAERGVELDVWRIHRRVGMSGGLFAQALLRETGRPVDGSEAILLQQLHEKAFARQAGSVRPLHGARELLDVLTRLGVPWAIATSGRRRRAEAMVELLDAPPDTILITRDEVAHAKPDPDLFLAAGERLGADAERLVVVGDSVWDLLAARRARCLGVGVLSGGYGREELERAGALRVYDDPADMLLHLDEIAPRTRD